MSAPTDVELYFVKGKIERWLRFGEPISERTLDRRRRIATFAPGAIFAFIRWAANAHGTLVSRVASCAPATTASPAPPFRV